MFTGAFLQGSCSFNQFVAKDAYSLMLHYNNDYSSILNTCYCVSNSVTLPATHSMKVLYNGNIAGMSLSIPKLQYPLKTPATRLGNMYYNYKYDQLNRLTRMDAYTRQLISQNSLVYSAALNSYKERISYDPNGNILTYLRNGADSSSLTGLPLPKLAMDTLTYKYYAKTNQLRQVTDKVPDGNYTEDIDNQSDTSNYLYDAIGNLVKDKKEGLDSIHWNVYGKIMSIHKTNDTTIYYTYDAGGNRISKSVLTPAGGGMDTATTWYARDASGNVMSVYTVHRDTALQDELHLYGSSRLGILKPERNLKLAVQYGQYDSSVSILGTAHGNVFRRGMKFFELANHLGNVLVTISDKKYGYDPGADGNVDYYNPVVMSANDYYPFGMVMSGRKYLAGNGYKYGFNGKENDNEVKGNGNQQDYGMRIYDPRLGRFLSTDPLQSTFPDLTPFQFSSNSPIASIDLDGLEQDWYIYEWRSKTGLTFLSTARQTREPTFANKIYDMFHLDDLLTRTNAKRRSEYDGDLIKTYSKNIVVNYYNDNGDYAGHKSYKWHKALFEANHSTALVKKASPSPESGMSAGEVVGWSMAFSYQEAVYASINADVIFANTTTAGTTPSASMSNQTIRINSGNNQGTNGSSTSKKTILYHYTTEQNQKSILSSQSLNASTKAVNPNDVRYGDGQYLSDIVPGTATPAQLSRAFLNMPFQGKKFTHYIAIDVTDLNVVRGRDGVFVIPNSGNLNLRTRIVGSGQVSQQTTASPTP